MAALTHVFFPIALLLVSSSLIIIASATDYGYPSKPEVYQTKPEVGTPKPDDVKYSEVEQPKPKQEDEKYPEVNKPKPEEGVKYTKIDKPKQEQKYLVEEKTEPEDVKYPEVYTPKPEEKVNVPSGFVDKPDEVKEDQFPVCFEGLILCKSGFSYEPIQGAVAKIICIAVDVLGYETRLPVSTCKTDAKGYFFSTLDYSLLKDGLKLRECKAFIESSPLEYCKVPTDVNNGITGALLSTYRILNDRKMKLYTVNPFFYTTKTVPSGY